MWGSLNVGEAVVQRIILVVCEGSSCVNELEFKLTYCYIQA